MCFVFLCVLWAMCMYFSAACLNFVVLLFDVRRLRSGMVTCCFLCCFVGLPISGCGV